MEALYGSVVKITIHIEEPLRVYAVVEFYRTEDASKAAADSGQQRLDNLVLVIERKEVNSTLYVGKLSPQITEQDLKLMIESTGHFPEKVIVLVDSVTKLPKGTGFIKFPSREEATQCLTVRNFCTHTVHTANTSRN